MGFQLIGSWPGRTDDRIFCWIEHGVNGVRLSRTCISGAPALTSTISRAPCLELRLGIIHRAFVGATIPRLPQTKKIITFLRAHRLCGVCVTAPVRVSHAAGGRVLSSSVSDVRDVHSRPYRMRTERHSQCRSSGKSSAPRQLPIAAEPHPR
jgi:hypothetical protein